MYSKTHINYWKDKVQLRSKEGGIYAASAQLRHSDIRITRNTYVEKRGRHTVPISDFISDDPVEEVEAAS